MGSYTFLLPLETSRKLSALEMLVIWSIMSLSQLVDSNCFKRDYAIDPGNIGHMCKAARLKSNIFLCSITCMLRENATHWFHRLPGSNGYCLLDGALDLNDTCKYLSSWGLVDDIDIQSIKMSTIIHV